MLKAIRLNGTDILKENKNAKPIKIDDLFYYSKGLIGVVLLFAKGYFSIMMNKISLARFSKAVKSSSIKQFLWKALLFLIYAFLWSVILLLSFILISLLFVLPLTIVFYRIYISIDKIELKYISILSLIITGLTFIVTIFSIAVLFNSFLRELRENLNKKLDNEIEDLGETIYDIFMRQLRKIGYILKD